MRRVDICRSPVAGGSAPDVAPGFTTLGPTDEGSGRSGGISTGFALLSATLGGLGGRRHGRIACTALAAHLESTPSLTRARSPEWLTSSDPWGDRGQSVPPRRHRRPDLFLLGRRTPGALRRTRVPDVAAAERPRVRRGAVDDRDRRQPRRAQHRLAGLLGGCAGPRLREDRGRDRQRRPGRLPPGKQRERLRRRGQRQGLDRGTRCVLREVRHRQRAGGQLPGRQQPRHRRHRLGPGQRGRHPELLDRAQPEDPLGGGTAPHSRRPPDQPRRERQHDPAVLGSSALDDRRHLGSDGPVRGRDAVRRQRRSGQRLLRLALRRRPRQRREHPQADPVQPVLRADRRPHGAGRDHLPGVRVQHVQHAHAGGQRGRRHERPEGPHPGRHRHPLGLWLDPHRQEGRRHRRLRSAARSSRSRPTRPPARPTRPPRR